MESTDIINPTAMATPLANSGTRNSIPAAASGSNLASVAEGFPDITMISPADGGLPPFGQDMNGLLYMASDLKSYLMSGGYITFDQNQCNAIGGYPAGAVLGYMDSNGIYYQVKSLIDNNTYNFVETPSYIDGVHWSYVQTQSVAWGSITGSLSNQTDLQNTLNTLQPIDTAVNYTNITNCITAIPQDIKLELNDGTLTLKAGSRVYVPNGVGVFDVVTIESDLNTTRSSNVQEIYFVSNNGTVFNQWNNVYSGTSAPSGQTYMVWYDTANNVVKVTTDSGSTWTGGFSLPVCLATSNNTQITSIDRVFNFWGKIGDAVFINPGIEFLFANGFNSNGSYNSLKLTTSKLIVRELTQAEKNLGNVHIVLYSNQTLGFGDGYQIVKNSSERNTSTSYYYVEDENLTYVFNRKANEKFVYLGYIDVPNDELHIRRTIKLPNEQDVPKLAANNTFTGINTFEATGGNINITSRNIDITSIPSSTKYNYIDFYDKNNQRLGVIGAFQFATGEYGIYLQAGNVSSMNIRTNGTNSYTSAPTPATNDNSTQIATTAFVNNFFNTAGRVTTKCMPNYAAGVSISSNYTAPSDGFIFCGLAGNSSESTTINGKQIAVTYDTGVSGSLPQICAPVSKGDVFKTNSQLKWGTFFPCKGA